MNPGQGGSICAGSKSGLLAATFGWLRFNPTDKIPSGIFPQAAPRHRFLPKFTVVNLGKNYLGDCGPEILSLLAKLKFQPTVSDGLSSLISYTGARL